MGENAPAAPQANAWGRLPRPIVAAIMNALMAWMRPEGQCTMALYMRGGPCQAREEGYINKHKEGTNRDSAVHRSRITIQYRNAVCRDTV
jgi:hypothetical protein